MLLREAWRTTVGATGLAEVTGEQARMLAVRRWRRELGLPDRVFLRLGTEIKPCYVDLSARSTPGSCARCSAVPPPR